MAGIHTGQGYLDLAVTRLYGVPDRDGGVHSGAECREVVRQGLAIVIHRLAKQSSANFSILFIISLPHPLQFAFIFFSRLA